MVAMLRVAKTTAIKSLARIHSNACHALVMPAVAKKASSLAPPTVFRYCLKSLVYLLALCLLVVPVSGYNDMATQNFVTSTSSGYTVRGDASSNTGSAVSEIGDFDNDGKMDIAIGFPGADQDNLMNVGVVWVLLAGGTVSDVYQGDAPGKRKFKIRGEFARSRLGTSLAGAGDVNGDGFDDIIIGASELSLQTTVFPPVYENRGCAYVIFGWAQNASVAYTNIDLSTWQWSTRGFRIYGENADDYMGLSVAGIGDVNGDGYDDVAVGNQGSSLGRTRNGAVTVVFGHSSSLAFNDVNRRASYNGFVIRGDMSSDYLGNWVDGAGDVNGDGVDDFVIGASNKDFSSRMDSGVAYIAFGRSGLTSVNISDTAPTRLLKIGGEATSNFLGNVITSAGDMNNDGYGDVLIGAYASSPFGRSQAGRVYVLYGGIFSSAVLDIGAQLGNGINGFKMNGPSSSGYFGRAASRAGDINADGYEDIVIGASDVSLPLGSNAGVVYVVFGGPTSNTNIDMASFSSGNLGYKINGPYQRAYMGTAVGNAGDFNGDGRPDLVIGAPQYSSTTLEFDGAGRAFVLFSQPPPPTVVPTAMPTIKPTRLPTLVPTRSPTGPSAVPTVVPTVAPTTVPTTAPIPEPSAVPSRAPTEAPIADPTTAPTLIPSEAPTAAPSEVPTEVPTAAPTEDPSTYPTMVPTLAPTPSPTMVPSESPSAAPTTAPSCSPTQEPSLHPSGSPSYAPTVYPTSPPTCSPSIAPTMRPTAAPSTTPGRVVVEALATQLLVGQTVAGAVRISATSLPATPVMISLRLADPGKPLSALGVFTPANFTVSDGQLSALSQVIYLTARQVGAGNVTVTTQSALETSIDVRYVGSRTVRVFAAGSAPATPTVSSATFSPDGSMVNLVFDAPTNQAGFANPFPCPSLLSFAGDATATCVWSAASRISIYPRYIAGQAVLQPRGNVTVRAGTIRPQCPVSISAAECADWDTVARTVVIVQAPSAPLKPHVVMVAPVAVGACNALTLDLTSSSGSAGRPWSSLRFQVRAAGGSQASAAALQVEKFLNRNYTLTPPTAIPADVLGKGLTYQIQATLFNFLNASGAATVNVTVLASADPVPVLSILGAPTRIMTRKDELLLDADAYTQTQSCSGSRSYAGLSYQWSAAARTSGSLDPFATVPSLRSASQNPANFKLPPFSMSVDTEYEVSVTVVYLASGTSTSTSVRIEVVPSELLAVIAGGQRRYAVVGDEVTSDASSSYDPDYPGTSAASLGLQFMWSCVRTLPTFSKVCPISNTSTPYARYRFTVTPDALNVTMGVTVVVTDGVRYSSAEVEVVVTGAPAPVLTITNDPTALRNVATTSSLALYGSVLPLKTCTARWTMSGVGAEQLQSMARTPVVQVMQPTTTSGVVPFNLVMIAGSLPERGSLIFTLSCDSTFTSIAVTTNGAPLPGIFTVTPAQGKELYTSFSFSASQWSDPDLPLTYQFGFISATSLANLVVVSRSQRGFATSSLPAGAEHAERAVTCTLAVFDALEAAAVVNTSVKVLPLDSSDKATALLGLVRNNSGSVDSTKQLIAVVSTVLNAANCSAAPNCTSLNRSPCVKTAGQCGACLPGYVGDHGDRNTYCVAASAANNVSLGSCASSVECPPWQQCDADSSQCRVLSKSCAGNCSGHGNCMFRNVGYDAPLPVCLLTDRQCQAVCSCDASYSGDACEVMDSQLVQNREIRSTLITSLSNLTRLEDINPKSVASWSAGLYSLSLRPHDLSVNDVSAVTSIANITLSNAQALDVTEYESMLGVLQATDAVASLVRYNYNPNDFDDPQFETARRYVNNTAAQVIPVVSAFGDLVAASLVLGEPRRDLLYETFRLSALLTEVSASLAPVPYAAPQVESEVASGVAPSTVLLEAMPEDARTAVAVKLITMNPSTYAANVSMQQYVSTPVVLQVRDQGSAQTSPADYLSRINFTFQHNAPQPEYVADRNITFRTLCTERNLTAHRSYRCPGSGHVVHHNCSEGAGEYVSFCPRPTAACARVLFDTATVVLPTSCVATNFTARGTSCSCALDAQDGAGRRLSTAEQSILDDSGTMDMMASTVYIASDFADTFRSAKGLNSADGASRVIVVIVMLGVLWVPALLFMTVDWLLPNRDQKHHAENAKVAVKDRVLRYVQTIIPVVYDEELPIFKRLWTEIASHHTFFALFQSNTPAKRRDQLCNMLTVFTFMLFLTAVFFDISNPGNDGSCDNYGNSESCLKRTSPFDNDRTYCKWDEVSGSCAYNSESMTLTALFYLCVLTTVLTSIATVPIDYCFKILNAPTVSSLEGLQVLNAMANNARNTLVQGAQRVSNAGALVARRVSGMVTALVPPRVTPSAAYSQENGAKKWFPMIKSVSQSFQRSSVVANREISEELQQCAEEARQVLPELSAAAKAAAANAERVRNEEREKSFKRLKSSAKLTSSAQTIDDHGEDGGLIAKDGHSPFVQEIILQRLLMNDLAQETRKFDAQWGIERLPTGLYSLLPAAERAIDTEVAAVDQETAELSAQIPHYSLHHAGLEILHLFMVDLLGKHTVAACIFKEKFGEEFGNNRAVYEAQQFAAGALLVGLNAFFMYFILLKGIEKGRTWQIQYVICSIIQLAIDVLVFETMECVWLNFTVPRVVKAEVTAAAAALTAVAEQSSDEQQLQLHSRASSRYFLNAPAHLFVSVKLAKAHPQLLESIIVGNFSQPLPGEICKTWLHCQDALAAQGLKEVAVTKPTVMRSLARSALLLGYACLAIPFAYQRVILSFLLPTAFSIISVVWFVAVNHPGAVAAVASFCGFVGAYTAWKHLRPRSGHVEDRQVLSTAEEREGEVSGVPTFLDEVVEEGKEAPSIHSSVENYNRVSGNLTNENKCCEGEQPEHEDPDDADQLQREGSYNKQVVPPQEREEMRLKPQGGPQSSMPTMVQQTGRGQKLAPLPAMTVQAGATSTLSSSPGTRRPLPRLPAISQSGGSTSAPVLPTVFRAAHAIGADAAGKWKPAPARADKHAKGVASNKVGVANTTETDTPVVFQWKGVSSGRK